MKDPFDFDDDGDEFPIVCDNGCPEGYLGRHKFSCELAGRVTLTVDQVNESYEWADRFMREHVKAPEDTFGNKES